MILRGKQRGFGEHVAGRRPLQNDHAAVPVVPQQMNFPLQHHEERGDRVAEMEQVRAGGGAAGPAAERPEDFGQAL